MLVELTSVFVAVVGLYAASQVRIPNLPPLDARLTLTGIFALLALLFLGGLSLFLSRGHPIELRSQWGGLGGSTGGWQISRPLLCLLAAVLFGGLAAVLNLPIQNPAGQKAVAAAESNPAPEGASKKGTAALSDAKPPAPTTEPNPSSPASVVAQKK
jgi:hypothetical protein